MHHGKYLEAATLKFQNELARGAYGTVQCQAICFGLELYRQYDEGTRQLAPDGSLPIRTSFQAACGKTYKNYIEKDLEIDVAYCMSSMVMVYGGKRTQESKRRVCATR